jgi:riboflavin synthase
MFTGIVSDIGTVAQARQLSDLRLTIRCSYDMGSVDLGSSICCSGVCLTVVDKGADWFAVDLSSETLSRTAGALWEEGSRINLERSLRVGEELGGHFVTGHVDCVGTVLEATPEGGSVRIAIAVPAAYAGLIAPKGSIALDGVSLTVNDVTDGGDGTVRFANNIIPHTVECTTLGSVEAGNQVNVEVDVLARYIDRMVQARAQ